MELLKPRQELLALLSSHQQGQPIAPIEYVKDDERGHGGRLSLLLDGRAAHPAECGSVLGGEGALFNQLTVGDTRLAKAYGPGLSGALFGGGWWFFVDSISTADHKINFLQFLPGIIATFALVMINCIRRDELFEAHDVYDEGVFCRARAWLFVSYCISFGAIVGAVWVLLSDYALNPDAANVWPGVAGLFQVTLILGSALLFFVSRTPADGTYTSF